MAKFISKLLIISPLLLLASCNTEDIISSSNPSIIGGSTSNTSQTSPVALRSPSILQSDNLIFWNEVGSASNYDIYKGDEKIGSTSSTSYLLNEGGDYTVVAVPSSEATDRKESKKSNVVNYVKQTNETILEVNLAHYINDFQEFNIPGDTDYVKLYWLGQDESERRTTVYNFGLVIENRTRPLTVDFDIIDSFRCTFPDKYLIRYKGRQSEMPLLSLYFPNGGTISSGNCDVNGRTGAYEDGWVAGYGIPARGEDGGNGQTLANLNNILLKYGQDLTITGGKGSNGGDGGSRSTYGNTGDGGNGGNGAPSFICTDSIYSVSLDGTAKLELKGGKAGKGGARGECPPSSLIDLLQSGEDGVDGRDGEPYKGRLVEIKYPN